MKRVLYLVAVLLSFFASGQPIPGINHHFSTDSLPAKLLNEWRFHEGDSTIWASPEHDDVGWIKASSELRMFSKPIKATEKFSSIAWMRYRFEIDTSLTGKPLSLSVSQYGASEIYLDGKKIKTYGVVGDKLHSEYYDPQNHPFVIVLANAGQHVLAVRYANYNAQRMLKYYKRDFAGFKMKLAHANSEMEGDFMLTLGLSSVLMFLFGIFIALCVIHMLLYLYYRAARSNLFFSIFCFCISFLFLLPFINHFSNNPSIQLNNIYVTLLAVAVACISFSGMSNTLFGKTGMRFKIIVFLALAAVAVYPIWPDESFEGLLVMTGIVSLESIVLIIRALRRKMKGTKIIGFGLIPLGVFFLTVVILALTQKNIEINDENLAGQILEVIGLLAILCLPISISIYLAWSFARINKELKEQLQQVELLSAKALQQEQEKKELLENQNEQLERDVAARTTEIVTQKQEIELQHAALKVEKQKSDDLLLNILPEEIAEELKQNGSSKAKFFDHVTVLFTDFVNFTKAGERMSAEELVDELHTCFMAFDNICAKYSIEKIKTIGDAYLAVCGLPMAQANHAEKIALAALDMRSYMAARRQQMGDKTFEIRIGIHSGSVVAGIVGVKKFAYDIWGDTVNTAARMEQHSEAGKINASEMTYELIRDKFACTHRGKIKAKSKGEMDMYFVDEG